MIIIAVVNLLTWVGVRGREWRDVATEGGQVRGYRAPHPPHYAYLGLPYARPPTHRFKHPNQPPRWDGIFEATHRIKCPQPDGSGDENCLILNVFTPVNAQSLPVLVHVHDGRFRKGWGSFHAPLRLLRDGIVIVTFNYRLGIAGFLCLGTSNIPGNAGLKDQVAALQWVHKNIEKFGGNPMDVTVYGTGSGAVSVELLMLSGVTKGLFGRTILESGSVFSPSAVTYDPLSVAFEVAKELGLEYDNDLMQLEHFFLSTSTRSLTNTSRLLLPCIEQFSNGLLDQNPFEIMKAGTFQQIPIMVVYTNAEEVTFIANSSELFTIAPDNFGPLLPNNLEFDTHETMKTVAKFVKNFYFGDFELSESVMQNYVDYINDVFVEYPTAKFVTSVAVKNLQPVYLMKYTYRGNLGNHKNKGIPGAEHGDVFKYIFSEDNLDSDNELVAEKLVTLCTNFIWMSDPTPITTSLIPVIWQPVVPRVVDGKININSASQFTFDRTMNNEPMSGEQLIFWDHIYNKFHKIH